MKQAILAALIAVTGWNCAGISGSLQACVKGTVQDGGPSLSTDIGVAIKGCLFEGTLYEVCIDQIFEDDKE